MHPVDLQTTALAIISRNQQCHSSAAACSFSREQNTVSTCRALTSPASPACPNPHSVLRHHSPAALLSRYLLTRFRALALFGRRSAERVVNSRRRRPKTLYGAYPCQIKNRHALSHFVTSLDCIAARLLSCSAALSGQRPEAACGAPKARGLTANAQTESQ